MYNLIDLHNDYFTALKLPFLKHLYAKKNANNKVCTAVWTTRMDADMAMKTVEQAKLFANAYKNMFWAIEDMHFASKTNLYEIANMHPTYCGLTWNYNNSLAGGALDFGGVSSFGKWAINLLENSGIYIDSAHLNEKSFMDLATFTQNPMLCTHTACDNICANSRNLKDYQLKIIAESGGLVGICLVKQFLCEGTCDALQYVKHINYAVNLIGIDHVAIGTDFYGTKNLPVGIKNYDSLLKIVTQQLRNLGYKDCDIEKILYKNAHDFFKMQI